MKKIFVTFGLWLTVLSLFAHPVDPNTAQQVAKNFFCHQTGKSTLTLTNITAQTTYSDLYIFNIEPNQGFVIVAADNCARPILGYSTQGSFSPDNISPEANYWLRLFEEQIRRAKNSKIVSPTTQERWEELLSNSSPSTKYQDEVAPLMSTTWNQRPYYNLYCPIDSSLYTYHATTGCTATAMGQIMKYWNWPEHGYGSYSYNWDNYDYWTYGTLSADFENTYYAWESMPNSLSEYSTAEEIDAVATLLYHVGVSIQMSYNIDGAGSSDAPIALQEFVDSMYMDHTYCPENAFPTFFGYKNTLYAHWRDNFSDTDWDNMLREEISNGRPILYGGFGIDSITGETNGGHAFVLDGYNNDGYFHVNWGWGGYCDGYFPTTALDADVYTFSDRQEILLGIEPNYDGVGVEEQTQSESVVFAQPGQIIVRNQQSQPIFVYDLQGRLVNYQATSDTETRIPIATAGIYLVRVGQTTTKVLVTR